MRYAVERERGGGENNIERRIAARLDPKAATFTGSTKS
jgi:hypothetical protein